MRKEKGITLIALVVTIIVLLILAAVTISLTIGNNGIISRAQSAGDLMENSALKEQEGLTNLSIEMGEIIGENSSGETYEPITYSFTPENVSVSVDDNNHSIIEGQCQVELSNAQGEVIDSASNNADGSLTFDCTINAEFPRPGTYVLGYVQQVNEDLEGWIYDKNRYELKVDVRVENGKLVAAYNETPIVFENRYETKPIDIKFGAVVLLNGANLTANKFEFTLKNSNGEIIDTAYNNADGNIEFDAITYNSEGTYNYTISQVNKGESYINYDGTIHTISVNIIDNNGNLQLGDPIMNPVFTNIYDEGIENP